MLCSYLLQLQASAGTVPVWITNPVGIITLEQKIAVSVLLPHATTALADTTVRKVLPGSIVKGGGAVVQKVQFPVMK